MRGCTLRNRTNEQKTTLMEMLFQHTLAFGYALPCLSQNFGTFAGTNDRMRLPLDGPHSRSPHKRAILMWSACILFCIALCDAGPNVSQVSQPWETAGRDEGWKPGDFEPLKSIHNTTPLTFHLR
ncbi:uncharacterized protein MCYG_07383 [Microsporum canis CBS 113480]|uniref:Uncharacterized protein n=1 Tax=Arthroderma otae (strain ATCC MYA-4605 / CBS 113480) TaxID=554155 RepID=C5FYG6_ARTOC|nr:uncharacterized protein MCYG_07383 [Microsporum canis CBS 113480]EEQ34564.1 predicted protein [Microsporum canis CBS 113480]